MMYVSKLKIVTLASALAVSGCGGSGSSASNPVENIGPAIGVPSDVIGQYRTISSTELNSRGHGAVNTYQYIESILASGSIEAPDLYGSLNHADVGHIFERSDALVGDYFEFHIHLDHDKDRDKVDNDDRQRNEIKVYDKSDDKLKGFLNTTFEYSWKFKVSQTFQVTSHFTHLFQLKAVSSNSSDPISQPLITITANTKSGKPGLEVRHVDKQSEHTALAHTSYENISWENDIQGQWIEAFVRASYGESNTLYVSLTPLGDDKPMVEINRKDVQLWRSGSTNNTKTFVRPKWGIYRSLNDRENLQDDIVSFADFKISQVESLIE